MFSIKLKKTKKRLLEKSDIERLDKIFARHSDNVGYKIVDGKAVILNLESGAYFSLDEVGAVMWELFKENKNLAEVAKETAHQFDVSHRDISGDLIELVNELGLMDLVEIKKLDIG